MDFIPLQGDDLGICRSGNYRLIQTIDGHIVFSYTRQGKAMTVHFAADKQGLRQLKEAFNEFCQWLFNHYEWCRMILGFIKKKSVERMVKKCHCIHIANSNDVKIFMRIR